MMRIKLLIYRLHSIFKRIPLIIKMISEDGSSADDDDGDSGASDRPLDSSSNEESTELSDDN